MHAHHIDRAAAILAHLSRVSSLVGGFVTFRADDLDGGEWHTPDEYGFTLSDVWAMVPPFDSEKELLARCRLQVQLALEANAHARQENEES